MHIRKAIVRDVPSIIALFQQTIVQATIGDYNQKQREAWAARGNDSARWRERIAIQHFLLAERPDGLLGFGSINDDGYLDTLFVHHACQRQGIATRLLTALEEWATEQDAKTITTNASITARPFFARHGYQTLAEQQNKIAEEVLINYRMQKIV